MNAATVRRARLEQLLDLAQAYKGCSRKELARLLGRDPTKLVPGTGVPKLDLVIELAGVLDWPVGEVANYLWAQGATAAGQSSGADFEELDAAAGQAYRDGRYDVMLRFAREAIFIARTPEQRARACNREAGASDGLGRYTDVLSATKHGLRETGISGEFRRTLQSNLANAYYCLWAPDESGAIARSLLAWYSANAPKTARDLRTEAFAWYVSGHTFRRLLTLEPERTPTLAASARADLQRAAERFEALAEEDESLDGVANTCRGGVIEADVALERRSAEDGLAELAEGLDAVRDLHDGLPAGQMESYGWWCIFGCNIALRNVTDERELQQHMAVFTNKADEIADRLDNWSMRERVFTMQYTRWERAMSTSGFDIPCVIDTDDVRVIAGTMGRFPTFRDTGWRILESAQVVDGN